MEFGTRTLLLAVAVAAVSPALAPAWAQPATVADETTLADGTAPPSLQDVSALLRPADDMATEAEELIFELRLNNLILSEAFPVLLRGASLMLPLGELASALEFPISEDARAGRASGWFIRENRLFSLDVGRGELILEGRSVEVDRGAIVLEPDGIYVDIRELARWFPIDFSFDTANLTAFVVSREPLPVEERLARGLYRQRALAARRGPTDYERIDIPRHVFSPPVLDLSTELSGQRDTRTRGSRSAMRYSALMTGELAFANSEIYAAGNDRDRLSDMRIRLDRMDPDGHALDDLGVAGITEASVGDVLTPQAPLVSGLQLGRGAVLSNMDLSTPDEFDRTTLEGNLPLGWEVELYRNEVLLDFQTPSEDGRYRFDDVALLFGVNVLRLVFYGPQGQRREEVQQIRVAADQLNPGDVRFRVAAAEHDRRVYSGAYRSRESEIEGRARGFANALVGVSDWLTVGANLSSLPRADRGGDYAGGTAIVTHRHYLWRLDGVNELDAGHAARLSGQTSLAGLSVFGEHGVFNDFVSEQATGTPGNLLKSRSRLRFDGLLPGIDIVQVPYSLFGEREERDSGNRVTRLGTRLSTGIGRAALTNRLDWARFRGPATSTDTTTGSFLVGGPINSVRLRGQVDYRLSPQNEISATSFSIEKTLW